MIKNMGLPEGDPLYDAWDVVKVPGWVGKRYWIQTDGGMSLIICDTKTTRIIRVGGTIEHALGKLKELESEGNECATTA